MVLKKNTPMNIQRKMVVVLAKELFRREKFNTSFNQLLQQEHIKCIHKLEETLPMESANETF